MKFGIFDHMDAAGLPLCEHYEDRLRLIEAYDRAGFTPTTWLNTTVRHWVLRLRPVFSWRRSRSAPGIRFGPLVYLLPLYHSLRMIEEI